MSSKLANFANAAIAAIVIIVTFIVFFFGITNHPKEIIDWLALAFILISEVILFGSTTFILIRKSTTNQVLIRLGIVFTAFIYWVVTTIISIFARDIFKHNVGGFAATQIIICAVTLIIAIILYVFSINVKEKDAKIVSSRRLMQECENVAFSLKSNVALDNYSVLLNKVYEEIKYSDKTISVNEEWNIYEEITKLSNLLLDNANEVTVQDISKIVDGIILQIKERNLAVKQSKQGEF